MGGRPQLTCVYRPTWPYNILSSENVTINTPTGNKIVPNPLFRYRFQGQPYPSGFFNDEPLGRANTTLRGTVQAPTRDDLSGEEYGYSAPNMAAGIVSSWITLLERTHARLIHQ